MFHVRSIFLCFPFGRRVEMEIIPEGRHFRLVQDSELPQILEHLEQYLPEALKVRVCPLFHVSVRLRSI